MRLALAAGAPSFWSRMGVTALLAIVSLFLIFDVSRRFGDKSMWSAFIGLSFVLAAAVLFPLRSSLVHEYSLHRFYDGVTRADFHGIPEPPLLLERAADIRKLEDMLTHSSADATFYIVFGEHGVGKT
jgi:hypothetical protein